MCKSGSNRSLGLPQSIELAWKNLGKTAKSLTNFMEVAKRASFLRWLELLNPLETVSYETVDQTQTGSEQKSTLAFEAPNDIFSQHKKAPVTDDLSYSY